MHSSVGQYMCAVCSHLFIAITCAHCCPPKDRNQGRELQSIAKPTNCRMICRQPTCENEFRAKKVDTGEWVVTLRPHCTCPPLSNVQKRKRAPKAAFASAAVLDATRKIVATRVGASKVKQVAAKVYEQTGTQLKYAQCRCRLREIPTYPPCDPSHPSDQP